MSKDFLDLLNLLANYGWVGKNLEGKIGIAGENTCVFKMR